MIDADTIANDILPPLVRDFLEENAGTILAGGALRNIWDYCGIKDYDIYFANEASLKGATKFFRDHEKIENGFGSIENYHRYGIDFQLIHINYYHNSPTLLNDFDFMCCGFALAFTDEGWKFDNLVGAIEDATAKKLRILNPRDPYGTAHRIPRFLSRGYTMEREEWNKLLIHPINTTKSNGTY